MPKEQLKFILMCIGAVLIVVIRFLAIFMVDPWCRRFLRSASRSQHCEMDYLMPGFISYPDRAAASGMLVYLECRCGNFCHVNAHHDLQDAAVPRLAHLKQAVAKSHASPKASGFRLNGCREGCASQSSVHATILDLVRGDYSLTVRRV